MITTGSIFAHGGGGRGGAGMHLGGGGSGGVVVLDSPAIEVKPTGAIWRSAAAAVVAAT